MRGKDAIVLTVCGLAAATGAGVWVMGGGDEVVAPEQVITMASPEPEVIEPPVRVPRVRPAREPAPVVEAEPEPVPAPEREERPEGERRERGGFDRDAMMKRFDKNGDGEIDDEERQAIREEMGNRRGGRGDSQMQQIIMRRYDADGDGDLSDAEREVARAEFREIRDEIQARIVPQYDLDGDGELNRQEREAAGPAYRAEYERVRAFAVLDEDGSGDVNPIELAKAISAVGEGSELMDLNRDGEIDYEDVTYATEVATDGK